jgi:hypothetical protein
MLAVHAASHTLTDQVPGSRTALLASWAASLVGLVKLQARDVQQLHVEDDRREGGDGGPAGCSLEVLGEGQVAGHKQPPEAAGLHAANALVQAGDDLTGAHPGSKPGGAGSESAREQCPAFGSGLFAGC